MPRAPPFLSPTFASAASPEPGATPSSKRWRSLSPASSDSTLTDLSDLSDPDDAQSDSGSYNSSSSDSACSGGCFQNDVTQTRLSKRMIPNYRMHRDQVQYKKRRVSAPAAPEASSRRRTTHEEMHDADDEDEAGVNPDDKDKGKGKCKRKPQKHKKPSIKPVQLPRPPPPPPPPAPDSMYVPVFLRTRSHLSMSVTSPAAARTSTSPKLVRRSPRSLKEHTATFDRPPRSTKPPPAASSDLETPEAGQLEPDTAVTMRASDAAIFSPELGPELALPSMAGPSHLGTPPGNAFPRDEPHNGPSAPAPAPADETDATQSSDDEPEIVAQQLLRPTPLKRKRKYSRVVKNAGQASTSEDEPLCKRLVELSPELGDFDPKLRDSIVVTARLQSVSEAAESAEKALARASPRTGLRPPPRAPASEPSAEWSRSGKTWPSAEEDDAPESSPPARAAPTPATSSGVSGLVSQYDSHEQKSVPLEHATLRLSCALSVAITPSPVAGPAPTPALPPSLPSLAALPPPPKKRGRPLGSKNKPEKIAAGDLAGNVQPSLPPTLARTSIKRAPSSQRTASTKPADVLSFAPSDFYPGSPLQNQTPATHVPPPRKVVAKVVAKVDVEALPDLPGSLGPQSAGDTRVAAPKHSVGGFSSIGCVTGGSSSNGALRDGVARTSIDLAVAVPLSSCTRNPDIFSSHLAQPRHHHSIEGSTSTSYSSFADTNPLLSATRIFPSTTPPVAPARPETPQPPVAFSQFASNTPTSFVPPHGSLPPGSPFAFQPLPLLPRPQLAPVASAPPYAPCWTGSPPAQWPAMHRELELPTKPATAQPRPPKVKARKPPKAPKPPKALKSLAVRPEFTISKSDWIVPTALPMTVVEPPIVLRPDPVGERPPKNPHRERVGVELVEEKHKGDLGLILRTVAGPLRAPAKSNKSKEKPSESVESKEDTFTLVNELPPIWCMGRQELCEALPYYHSYQGGHYDKDERCIGYLLDAFPSPKDCCADGGRILISHGGGCSVVSKEEGYHLTSNQERANLRVRALINCHKTQCPVVLIAGSSYDFFPWLATRKIRYAVLGYYFVDKFWAEAEPLASDPTQYLVRFKFKFVWAPSQGEPWFSKVIGGTSSSSIPALPHSPVSQIDQLLIDAPPSTMTDLAPTFVEDEPPALHETTCRTCSAVSTSVYEEDVSCYDERCPSFFQVNGVVAHAKNLTIRAPFLRAVDNATWPQTVPLPLIPKSMADVLEASVNFSQEGWRAFICGKCGRLSSRSQWHQLECECCGNVVPVVYNKYTPAEASKPLPGGLVAPGKMAAGITNTPIALPGFTGCSYHLSPTAIVHHLRPTNAPDLAETDRFFEEYQQDAAAKLLRRNALGMHKVPGEFLCSQFSFNTGKAYKHVVKVPTYSFEESPQVVTDACNYLARVSRSVVTLPSATAAGAFNEVLSVAYMRGSKMNFHDDGEKGLGPLVTTLSLGGEAAMAFRRKNKKSKVKIEDVPPPEPADATAPGAKRTGPRTLLTLKLVHGDITIMEGEDVQKYFEHAIVAKDGLRFAPTCREIGPDHYL